MLDHLLDKFGEKDKIILHKMIKASLENDDEADLAHRVFKSGPQIAKEVRQDDAYAHVGGEKRPPYGVETPRSTAQGLPAESTKTQLDGQSGYVDSEMPKSSPANYGMKMMMKNGWRPGQGLGARGDGITEPVLLADQLVPDRKDYNPGVGSRERMEYQVTQRKSSAANQAINAQELHTGSTLHVTAGHSTDENKSSTTGSAKSDGEAWECLFDRDPLLFESRLRYPNSYCNGW
ncbi:hypothetical protein PG988_009724 [Apiospora saccharicola]